MTPPNTDGWMEYRKHVLSELERHSDGLEILQRDVAAIHSEIAALKVKAGLWGLVAGAIPTALLALAQSLK